MNQVPHDSAASLACCIYSTRSQKQERGARADRVGVQAGLLCERLFYIRRNYVPSRSIPFG